MLLLDLHGKVVFETGLFDGTQLGFEPIDVFFGIDDHVLEYVPGGEISDLGAVRDGLPKQLRVLPLKIQIGGKQRRRVLSVRDGIQVFDVGRTIQVEHMVYQAG